MMLGERTSYENTCNDIIYIKFKKNQYKVIYEYIKRENTNNIDIKIKSNFKMVKREESGKGVQL